jgi:hypothetical protein
MTDGAGQRIRVVGTERAAVVKKGITPCLYEARLYRATKLLLALIDSVTQRGPELDEVMALYGIEAARKLVAEFEAAQPAEAGEG